MLNLHRTEYTFLVLPIYYIHRCVQHSTLSTFPSSVKKKVTGISGGIRTLVRYCSKIERVTRKGLVNQSNPFIPLRSCNVLAIDLLPRAHMTERSRRRHSPGPSSFSHRFQTGHLISLNTSRATPDCSMVDGTCFMVNATELGSHLQTLTAHYQKTTLFHHRLGILNNVFDLVLGYRLMRRSRA